MSYAIYDAKGFVGDLASGGGLSELMRWLRAQASSSIAELARHGYTLHPRELAKDLRELVTGQGEAETSARLLADLLERCEEIGIISDGSTDVEE